MRRKWMAAAALGLSGAALGYAGPAGASGDYGCYPSWSLDHPDLDCESSIVMAPGNDTRVNLALLLRDKAGLASRAGSYPKLDWDYSYAHNYFDWQLFRSAFYGEESGGDETWPDNPYSGSRCVSLPGGDEAFAAAVAANNRLSADERQQLTGARGQLKPICDGLARSAMYSDDQDTPPPQPVWPASVSSKTGQEFLTYLVSAAAFYSENWDAARGGFSSLSTASDPWLKETARYMLARVDLNAAQAPSFDQWGFYQGPEKSDQAAVTRAGQALDAYLKAYPDGRYASSATGLERRVLWLANDLPGLAAIYAQMLNAAAPDSMQEVRLIEEADSKLLLAEGAERAIDTPLLLATSDLARMRSHESGYDYGQPPIDEAELASQEKLFAGHTPLYQFVRANYSFYAAGNSQDVLKRIADGSGAKSYSALEFSRQVLRGQALAALKDPGEEAFWLRMLGGATGLYQRPTVELGLALHYEKAGQLAKVFAPSSPIEETMIRKLLLEYSAGPAILRTQAQNAARPRAERDLALFVLLYKQLIRGQYSQYLADAALVPAGSNVDSGLWDLTGHEEVPVGLFTAGKWSDGYACPALNETVATLARNPKDVKGRLCLGDFYRINGFDNFSELDGSGAEDGRDLGTHEKPDFSGSVIPRGDFYKDIIADPRAARGDRAYALFRAVMCYARSGNNSCGGEDVPEAQRKAWFETLKRQYADTRWAKELKYYW